MGIAMTKEKKDYKQLAEDILALVGGQENVDNVIHCITRLRFYLKDDSKADRDQLEELPGVMGIAKSNDQYQVIVGQAVDEIYDELTTLLPNQQDEKEVETSARLRDQETVKDKIHYIYNQVIGVITGAVMPIIHILAASGIIKSVLAIGTTSGWIIESSCDSLIINIMLYIIFIFILLLIIC